MAWLNTAPRDERKKALEGAPDEELVTRLARLRADEIDPVMPPLSAPSYIDYLMDVGPTEPTGVGPAVISWLTLSGWQESTGTSLQPWELRLLRSLSGDWLAESERAKKPDCPSPWAGETTEFNREAVARKVSGAFKALAQRPTRDGLQ